MHLKFRELAIYCTLVLGPLIYSSLSLEVETNIYRFDVYHYHYPEEFFCLRQKFKIHAYLAFLLISPYIKAWDKFDLTVSSI